ncbi:MAG TPA: ATP-binding protein [Candidatus Lustribacter sp.]|nr:ATP-binding protein [Candidatus Lustribacter sp.]
MLVKAIRNLVGNAIAYSESGTQVTVKVRPSGSFVEVSVSDEGQGISPTDQERIFERFYRVDAARSRATGGTGLGLAIVKHVCVNHGGAVSVWSQVGAGSTFTIRLPGASLPPGEPAPSRHTHPMTDRSAHWYGGPDPSSSARPADPATAVDATPGTASPFRDPAPAAGSRRVPVGARTRTAGPRSPQRHSREATL